MSVHSVGMTRRLPPFRDKSGRRVTDMNECNSHAYYNMYSAALTSRLRSTMISAPAGHDHGRVRAVGQLAMLCCGH